MITHLIDISGVIQPAVLKAIAAGFKTGDRVVAFDDEVHDFGVLERPGQSVEIAWRGGGVADIGKALLLLGDAGGGSIACYSDGDFVDGRGTESSSVRENPTSKAGRLLMLSNADMLQGRPADGFGDPIDASQADRPVSVKLGRGNMRIVCVPNGSRSPVDVLELYELISSMLFEANVGDSNERLEAAQAIHDLIESRMADKD